MSGFSPPPKKKNAKKKKQKCSLLLRIESHNCEFSTSSLRVISASILQFKLVNCYTAISAFSCIFDKKKKKRTLVSRESPLFFSSSSSFGRFTYKKQREGEEEEREI